ncbi:AlbA family DNA-binding domain-containing protein [Cupriavidus plantarum]|uniref:Putative DNA-binding protein n=1 Tax=Cupriavidus plantarum TaxID=942865 RepID=A0A316EMZ3_9BURK|nr:ATP-binding protein [Cupriavidus plantarum]PWK33499.1 putative DNA-binding protein [Cupriavidus plantarum]
MPYTLEEVQQFVIDSANESQTLEFKQRLPLKDHDARAEFAKDVSAMANAEGGSILYGIAEAKGCASALHPITDEAFDHARRRLQQTLSSAVEPAALPVTFHEIRCDNGGYVLEVQVERSAGGPHRVIEDGRSHFYVRTPTQVTSMRYDELREAFNASERAADRFRRWRQQLDDMVYSDATRWTLCPGPKAVLLVAPMEAFQRRRLLDMRQVHAAFRTYCFGDTSRLRPTFNLDGVSIRYPLDKETDHRHIQVFRNGAIQSCWMIGSYLNDKNILPSQVIVNDIRDAIRLHLRRLLDNGFTGPAIVALSLVRVENSEMAVSRHTTRATDRDYLDLPEFVVDDIPAAVENVDIVAHSLLDMLWQCFGEPNCSYYDPDTGEFFKELRQ